MVMNGNLIIKKQGRLMKYLVLFFDREPHVPLYVKINNKQYYVHAVYDLPKCFGIEEPEDVDYVGAEVVPA